MTQQAKPLYPTEIETLAARQWQNYRACTPGLYFADPNVSLSLDDAYALQMSVARLRCAGGDEVAGYKVGCIGPGIIEQFGMSGPIHARLFRSELRVSGETLRYRSFANLAIEGEMAVRIGLNDTIEAAFPVIELHHFVFRGARKTLVELVANNGINGGAVLSDRNVAASLADWTGSQVLSVAINGVTLERGGLWAMEGGAEEAVEWLRQDLHRFGCSLKPGDIVLAGTPLGLHSVKPGDHVVVSIDDRSCVECRVVG
ncbi:MAG: hypothetical protein A4S14_06050 [Proteobacteria bacterium SG_bin9]|jgi:2-keto-4-pentenoate hydratase|nr:MAG: hypothetical protein A4S14_06050 [Proteobacteria bacterium SG_bin9]